jgi:UDP-glucose 4-epimerase
MAAAPAEEAGNVRSSEELVSTPVIVTGAAGFIGSHAVRALAHSGRTVVATDLAPALRPETLRGLTDPKVTYVVGDLRAPSTMDRVFEAAGATVDVVNFAAFTRFHGEATPTPADALEGFSVNCMGYLELCGRVASVGVELRRFVHISTRSVFGRLPPTSEAIREDHAYCPAGIYGSSKAAGEVGVFALREAFSLNLVVARITGIFGPWKRPGSVTDRMFHAAARRERFRVDAGAQDAYELTYVKDTVRGVLTLLHARSMQHPVYHVASGRMTTVAQVAEAIREADPEVEIDVGTDKPSDVWPRTPLDVSRVAEELGFRAQWGLPDAARDLLSNVRTGSYGPEIEVGVSLVG